MKKLIVLGATSGIAQAVQRKAAQEGKELLLVARSAGRLEVLRQDLLVRGAANVLTFAIDLDNIEQHARLIDFAQKNFAGFDTLLLAYGSMLDQTQCDHSGELTAQQLHTDFVSAAALLTAFSDYFESRKGGCIAVITSVAGDRIRRSNYVYGTAKGALTLFLAGLRSRLRGAGVKVITIKPGPVNTAMTAHLENSGRFADPEMVAQDIYRALQRQSPKIVYTPGLWRYIMMAVRAIPEPVFNWLVSRHGPSPARSKKP